MQNRQYKSVNLFFHLPFLLWVVAGGLLLQSYSKQDLFFSINSRYSDAADIIMYYATIMGQAEVIIPMLLILMILPVYRNWWYFTTATLCNIVPMIIQQFIKNKLNAPRPMLFIHDTASIHFLPHWPRLLHTGFPSGHSEGAFSLFCFLSLLLPGRYRWMGFVLFLLALSVCYSRIYLAAHFFEDVYAGSIIGTITTTAIFAIMYRYRKFFFKRQPETI